MPPRADAVRPVCVSAVLPSQGRPPKQNGAVELPRPPRSTCAVPAPLFRRLLRKIDPLAQFLARLEMRDELLRNLYLLAGLGIASGARRPVVQAEAAEPADLDAFALREGLAHRVEDHLDRKLGILGYQLRKLRREAVDQLRFGHCPTLAQVSRWSWCRKAWP